VTTRRVPSDAAHITGLASALPPSRDQAELWSGYFREHFAGARWASRVFSSAGVRRRNCVVDPTAEDISSWSTGARMQRYLAEAMPLGKSALSGALADAGLAPGDIALLVVASCTGYATPGIDIHLARDLDMASDTQRLLVGHMGCYAAVPALATVRDFVVTHRRPAVLLSVELCSLHLQPPTDDLEQVLTHALFADAACAVVVEAGDGEEPTRRDLTGLSIVDLVSVTDTAAAEDMTWTITDTGFRMTLSRRVPDVLARHVDALIDTLLARHGLAVADVAGWAVHPGGPRILDVVAERLGLDDDALAESRHVLAEHGNCSSATVLLVLEQLRRRPQLPAHSYVVALAFGPGLTLYAALLRVR
jgi:alkylresorcinol/alkylpyrone synthase